MKKKARFLQFAAPYSDETQHSISQAVLLEGKYWKRRLETVSHEFKKWRRLHKEKVWFYLFLPFLILYPQSCMQFKNIWLKENK